MNTVTTTYYNIEHKRKNYAGEVMWSNMTHHDNITDRAEAEALLEYKKFRWTEYLNGEIEKANDQETVDHLQRQIDNNEWRIVEDGKVFTHASMYGYSDVEAYEIVKVISENTLEIRRLHADFDISHLKQHVGGFSAHVENQRAQKVTYRSDENNDTMRIRRKKNNPELWGYKNSKFRLETEPYAFYDFNF